MIKLLFGNFYNFSIFISICFFLLLVITQVAIPLIRNTSLFPWFSRKPRLSREIAQVNEQAEEERLKMELEQKLAQLAALQNKKAPQPEPRFTSPPPNPSSRPSPRPRPSPRSRPNQ
jgi:hypothetical protein